MSQSQDDFLALDVQLVSRLHELTRAIGALYSSPDSSDGPADLLSLPPVDFSSGAALAGGLAASTSGALVLRRNRLDHYSATGVWCVTPAEVEEAFRGAANGEHERD